MIVKSKVLTDFLSKIKGTGSSFISEVKVNFGNTITCDAKNIEGTVICFSELTPTEITGYNPFGSIGIDDLPTFISIISGFDKLELEKNNNLLTFKEGGRKIETILTNPEFIESPMVKELSFTEALTVDAKKVNKFISDAKLSKDFVLKIRTAPKQLILETDGKYKFTEVIDAPEAIGGVEVKVAAPFIHNMASFDGKVILKLKTNYPVMILEKTETSNVAIYVAPYIDNQAPAPEAKTEESA